LVAEFGFLGAAAQAAHLLLQLADPGDQRADQLTAAGRCPARRRRPRRADRAAAAAKLVEVPPRLQQLVLQRDGLAPCQRLAARAPVHSRAGRGRRLRSDAEQPLGEEVGWFDKAPGLQSPNKEPARSFSEARFWSDPPEGAGNTAPRPNTGGGPPAENAKGG